MKDTEDEVNWEKWMSRITPCKIGAGLSLIGIIYSLIIFENSGGWSLLGLMFFVPIAVGYLVCHFIIKVIFEGRIQVIWTIELIIFIFSLFIFMTLLGGR
jgi:xanthosine utilization system XapX-like protein